MIKSPLRYPGGKSRAVKLISTLIPEFDEFREPFLGGGSVFVNAKQHFPIKKFWVNDLYFELFKFWEMTQKDVDALTRKVYEWRNQFPIGKELHKFLNENLAGFNDLERATAFFIFLCQHYSLGFNIRNEKRNCKFRPKRKRIIYFKLSEALKNF